MTDLKPPLVWICSEDAGNLAAATALARHLHGAETEMRLVLSAPRAVLGQVADLGCPRADLVETPAGSGPAARAFLDRHAPFLLVWFGGLRPALMTALARRDLPMVLVNIALHELSPRGLGLGARKLRQPLGGFGHILGVDGATSSRLQKLGVSADRITVTGPLQEDASPPGHDPNELTVMAEAVGSRPAWFPNAIVPGEVAQIVAAHKGASRRSHRLLTIVSPRAVADGPDLARRLTRLGLRTALRSAEEPPEEDVQALVADSPGEAGLWYRLAPVCFMGGTLSGPDGPAPFTAASVGSAVLHGPFVQPWQAQYQRLSRAGAARKVRSGSELGAALGELIGPDRPATMAHAGWDEVTRSSVAYHDLTILIENAAFDGVLA
ncbi:3-deoxy-D-manno-octulosonic acid transferase [Roseovarius sp. SYSU LYC5161]|jgi:3-deoxy-D-manno-octulosonic-acid transferase|uniref:3-deoxy-D-manno-octulosonic acid transferase n=1 Tax=Roseovarius halophilus (ex Wu et al. 2025) TaxID=3376060 RepID=UPI00399B6D9E